MQRRWESLERHGLSRAHSLRIHGSGCGEEGLKRVCSAPQLGDQEKGSLLKRKLSVSDTEPSVVDRVSSKHKKQGQRTGILRACYHSQRIIYLNNVALNCLILISGAAKSSIQQIVKEKTCRKVSKDLLDPNDFECALCMRYITPLSRTYGHCSCSN